MNAQILKNYLDLKVSIPRATIPIVVPKYGIIIRSLVYSPIRQRITPTIVTTVSNTAIILLNVFVT